MNKDYQIAGQKDSRELAKFLAANGQVILPMVELIEQSGMAVDELLEVLGRSTLEAVLQISAAGVAGESHRGRPGGEIGASRCPGWSGKPFESEDASFSSPASEARWRYGKRGVDPGL
jgi:hypothetical protein